MTVQTLISDAIIWATILLVVVGGASGIGVAVISVLARPGGRLSPEAARAAIRRIFGIAAVVYVGTFFGGLIVGAFQP